VPASGIGEVVVTGGGYEGLDQKMSERTSGYCFNAYLRNGLVGVLLSALRIPRRWIDSESVESPSEFVGFSRGIKAGGTYGLRYGFAALCDIEGYSIGVAW